MSQVRRNFVYPEIITNETLIFGASFPSPVLVPDGDWRPYLPLDEHQLVSGIESSACFIYAQIHTIATLLEKQHGILDSNFGERFNALLANGTEYGGNPITGGESIRKDGLVKEATMPFSDDLESWWDYHSWKGVDEALARTEGREFLKKWKINYKVIVERNDPVDLVYSRMKNELLSSPLPMSVYGAVDATGNYIPKPVGASDTHMVEAVHIDKDNSIWIFDTYEPFVKKLPPYYKPDFVKSYVVSKLTEQPKVSCPGNIWNWILNLWNSKFIIPFRRSS